MSEATQSELDLDFAVLEEDEETYSSLTDIHGIPLFTDKFAEAKVRIESEAAAKEIQVENAMFADATQGISSNDELQSQMFLREQQPIIRQYFNYEAANTEYGSSVLLLGSIIFAIAMVIYIRHRKERIKEIEKGKIKWDI